MPLDAFEPMRAEADRPRTRPRPSATGQTLFRAGDHPVEVLERHPERGTVKVRRGPGQLPLWTLVVGLRCGGASPP